MRVRRPYDQTAQARRFWVVVGLICAIGGALAYQAGHFWVSDLLSGVKVETRAARVPRDSETEPAAALAQNAGARPPQKAVVTVEEREPSEGEKFEIQQKSLPEENDELEGATGGPSGVESGGAAEDLESPVAPTSERADTGDDFGEAKYLVVAGSFAQTSNAEKRAEALRRKGYEPFIMTYTSGGVTYHRVSVGAFRGRQEAQSRIRELAQEGIDARLVERP